jgi:hypothetical protein
MRDDFVHQQGSTVGHPARPAAGAEATALAAEGDQILIVTGLTPNPEETVIEPPTFQVFLKFLRDVGWQVLALAGQFSLELGPVLPDDLVEQRRFGPVAAVIDWQKG